MPLICYKPKNFSEERMGLIAKANRVIAKYQAEGFNLTLRQLYYVFVANDMFPDEWTYKMVGSGKWAQDPNGTKNAEPNYNALGNLISDGRMAGLIDWDAIVDRSRGSVANPHWTKPSQILSATVNQYSTDKWAEQPNYVEVWVEKEALEDVLARACKPLDVRFFACKGYTSQSAMWEASQRLVEQRSEGKNVHIIHLGDHDPSGIDMTRDIFDRLSTFVGHNEKWNDEPVTVHRIALNMNQVHQYNPPPNWAKVTDSRFKSYQETFGDESWELDALEPTVLLELIKQRVLSLRDEKTWEQSLACEQRGKHTLECIVKYFPDVVGFLRKRREQDDSAIICQDCLATVNNPVCRCNGGEVKKLL